MSAVLFVAMMMVQTNGNMNTSRATIEDGVQRDPAPPVAHHRSSPRPRKIRQLMAVNNSTSMKMLSAIAAA